MTGSTKTITHSGAIYNLSIDPSAGGGGTINLATTNAVTNIVSIAANDQLTIASTKVLTHNGTTLTLNGTITARQVHLQECHGFSNHGYVGCRAHLDVRHDAQ